MVSLLTCRHQLKLAKNYSKNRPGQWLTFVRLQIFVQLLTLKPEEIKSLEQSYQPIPLAINDLSGGVV
jgi:hypothetical protein